MSIANLICLALNVVILAGSVYLAKLNAAKRITPRMVKFARQVIDNRNAGIAPPNVPAQALATLVIGAAK